MRRDKKAAKKKKNRELARRDARRAAPATSFAAALKLARASDEIGPAFMSEEWRSAELPPEVVNVVFTRVLPDRSLVAHLTLIDRTCLGVKNAFSIGPITEGDLDGIFRQLEDAGAGGFEPVDFPDAQSVVLHAIAYARKLGFEPHRDFDEAMLRPLPTELRDTPLKEPARPFYVPGPDDDVLRVIEQLEKAVGEDGFDLDDRDVDGDGDEEDDAETGALED